MNPPPATRPAESSRGHRLGARGMAGCEVQGWPRGERHSAQKAGHTGAAPPRRRQRPRPRVSQLRQTTGSKRPRETAFGWDFSVTEPSRCAQESSSVTWDVGRGRVPASTADALGQTETPGWPRGLQATTLQGLLHAHSAGLPGAWSPPPRASPRGPRQPRQPRPPPVSLGDRSVKRACGTSCTGSSGSQRRVWSPGRLPAPCPSWGRGNRAPRASHSETTDVYCSQL